MTANKLKRYILFFVGVFINSFGISVITKADLGTSPISSVPYVLSLNFPFSLGEFTIAVNMLMVLAQLVILRRNLSSSMRCRSRSASSLAMPSISPAFL